MLLLRLLLLKLQLRLVTDYCIFVDSLTTYWTRTVQLEPWYYAVLMVNMLQMTTNTKIEIWWIISHDDPLIQPTRNGKQNASLTVHGNFRTVSCFWKSSQHTEHCNLRPTCSSSISTHGISWIFSFDRGGGPEFSIWLSICVITVSKPSRPHA